MELDTEHFQKTLFSDARCAFEKIIQQHGDDLYVIGLYHFGGWDSVMPLFNTKSDLKAVLERECSPEDRDCIISYKWNPASYPSLEQYAEHFEASEKEIRLLRGPITESSEEMQVRWQATLRAMESVMNALDQSGLFSNGIDRKELTLFIGTYDETYSLGFERINKINPKFVIDSIKDEFDYIIGREQQWKKEALDVAMKEMGLMDKR